MRKVINDACSNKCHLCSKQYQSPKDLEKHLKKIHGLSISHTKDFSEEEKTDFAKQCAKILEAVSKKKEHSDGISEQ